MQIIPTYKQWNKLAEQEAFEPVMGWGFRMAITAIAPVIWGIYTGRTMDASWITLTAESICWVELKGSFAQRLRILAGGILLTLIFSILGSITGTNIWLSVVAMLGVGFISGLFKNLGDRGAGLAICVYVIFLITNAYPTRDIHELQHRAGLVLAGGLWNALLGMVAVVAMPEQQPYRRTVAVIWKQISSLINTIAKGWDGNSVRSSLRDIYLKEKEVRSAIDVSLHLYETTAHQVSKKDGDEYELAQIRKATSLVGTHIIAMSDEMEQISIRDTNENLRLKLYALLKALQQTVDRMGVYIITLKPEEELLLSSRVSRVQKMIALLKEYNYDINDPHTEIYKRVTQLAERSLKLIESVIGRLETLGKGLSVYRSYSLIKTIFILHPKHWLRSLEILFNFNTFTTRYALRSAVASALALFISLWFKIDHGYWIPFTVIIVLQPYFGATLKKAIDRVIGTVLGGLAGGLFLYLPTGVFLQEAILFASFVLMVYFLHKRYSVAVFFITLSLVMLFDVEETLNPVLLLTRAGSTIGGAGLAIIAGFALLPHWDKKWLPRHMTTAICANYNYFIATFFGTKALINWTRQKRNAESKNSNAFDSFNRYMQEPSLKRKSYAIYYHLITHNVRITRELNNIHLEQEHKNEAEGDILTTNQLQRLNLCLYWFNNNMELVRQINPDIPAQTAPQQPLPIALTSQQLLYIDRMIIELKAMNSDLQKLSQRGQE